MIEEVQKLHCYMTKLCREMGCRCSWPPLTEWKESKKTWMRWSDSKFGRKLRIASDQLWGMAKLRDVGGLILDGD